MSCICGSGQPKPLSWNAAKPAMYINIFVGYFNIRSRYVLLDLRDRERTEIRIATCKDVVGYIRSKTKDSIELQIIIFPEFFMLFFVFLFVEIKRHKCIDAVECL